MPLAEETPPPPPIATTPQFFFGAGGVPVEVGGVGDRVTGGGAVALGDQGQRVGLLFAFGPHVDVGAGVVFVFASEVFFGGEEDLGAVGGHAVEEDAFGGAGGEFDRSLGVADVHVEVPVLGAFGFFDELADEDVGAVGGDVELGDAVGLPLGGIAGSLQAGRSSPARRLGDDVGFFGLKVAVIDRDVHLRSAIGLRSFDLEPKTRCSPLAERSLGDVAIGFGGGAGVFGAGHALDQFAARQVDGMPV